MRKTKSTSWIQPLEEKHDSPEQFRIRRAFYEMPFLGGYNIHFPNVGEMTWESVALNVEKMKERLQRLAEDYKKQGEELKRYRELINGAKDFFKEVTAPEPPAPSMDVRAHELIAQGKIIEAIKFVREQTGLGLKESKGYVDNLRGFKY